MPKKRKKSLVGWVSNIVSIENIGFTKATRTQETNDWRNYYYVVKPSILNLKVYKNYTRYRKQVRLTIEELP